MTLDSQQSKCILQNKDKPIAEWMKLLKIFKTGKQGITGLFQNKENKQKYAFKVSQFVNYLAEHEYLVMSRLNDIQDFCPHFCKAIDLIPTEVEPKTQKDANPFEIASKYPIQRNLLLEEYVDGLKLCKHLKKDSTSLESIFSAVKQTLAGISVAQDKCGFTHYDLHSDNIIMRPCDYDQVNLYIIDDETAFAFPTLGLLPVVIDFGFSYIDSMNDNALLCSLAHTDVGFISDRFDPVADAKVLLISMMEELKNYRPDEKKALKSFNNIVKNLFSELSVHWDCGWDDYDNEGASYRLLDKVQKTSSVKSKMFKKYGDFCLDIMLSLITLPLAEGRTKDMQMSYDIFVKEFTKIEEEISSSVYNLYVLKAMVDSARELRCIYESDDTRKSAVSSFQKSVLSAIHKVSKFCSPKKVHYERLLCSLYTFTDCANGYLFKTINSHVEKKAEEYGNLPIMSVNDILNILSVNLEDTYEYNKNTKIVVYDASNETKSEVQLSKKDLNMLNQYPSFMRGGILLQLYQHQHNIERKSKSKDMAEMELDEKNQEDYEVDHEDEDENEEEDDENGKENEDDGNEDEDDGNENEDEDDGNENEDEDDGNEDDDEDLNQSDDTQNDEDDKDENLSEENWEDDDDEDCELSD